LPTRLALASIFVPKDDIAVFSPFT
jgi:hypothetical protein